MPAVDASTALTDSLRRLAQERDPQAWGAVLELAGGELRRLALAITGDPGLADDVVQNTLLQVRDDARQFQPRGDAGDADARRWLLRVCSNAALQTLRTRRRAARREALHAAGRSQTAEAASPEQALIASERASSLRQALAELPEPMREPILMRHLLGLPFADVARRLGVPVGTAKVRVHRGLERLRTRLEREGRALSLALLVSSLDGLRPDAPPPAAIAPRRPPAPRSHARPGARLAPKLVAASVSLVIVALGAIAALERSRHEPASAAAPPPLARNAERNAAAGSAAPAPASAATTAGVAPKRTRVTVVVSF